MKVIKKTIPRTKTLGKVPPKQQTALNLAALKHTIAAVEDLIRDLPKEDPSSRSAKTLLKQLKARLKRFPRSDLPPVCYCGGECHCQSCSPEHYCNVCNDDD